MMGRNAPLHAVSASDVETGSEIVDHQRSVDRERRDAGASELWIGANDAVLRGLAHLLSNRTGTIGALAEALSSDGPDEALAGSLTAEADRLRTLLDLLRLMPRDPERGPEPLRPADVVAEAAALFGHHERGRLTPVSMVDMEEAPPVRVRMSSMRHALLVLLAAAAGPDGAPVSVRGDGADGVTLLKVTGDAVTGDGADAAAAAASAILAADDGRVTADGITIDGPAFVVSLPSLRPAAK